MLCRERRVGVEGNEEGPQLARDLELCARERAVSTAARVARGARSARRTQALLPFGLGVVERKVVDALEASRVAHLVPKLDDVLLLALERVAPAGRMSSSARRPVGLASCAGWTDPTDCHASTQLRRVKRPIVGALVKHASARKTTSSGSTPRSRQYCIVPSMPISSCEAGSARRRQLRTHERERSRARRTAVRRPDRLEVAGERGIADCCAGRGGCCGSRIAEEGVHRVVQPPGRSLEEPRRVGRPAES